MATGAYLLPSTSSATYSVARPSVSSKYQIWQALCKPLQQPQVNSEGAGIRFVIDSNIAESNWALEFKPLIENLSEQNAGLLLDALKGLFHPAMNNHERLRTINAFLQIAPASWKELSEQIGHLLPAQSRGHDIMWVSETLAGISQQHFAMNWSALQLYFILGELQA